MKNKIHDTFLKIGNSFFLGLIFLILVIFTIMRPDYVTDRAYTILNCTCSVLIMILAGSDLIAYITGYSIYKGELKDLEELKSDLLTEEERKELWKDIKKLKVIKSYSISKAFDMFNPINKIKVSDELYSKYETKMNKIDFDKEVLKLVFKKLISKGGKIIAMTKPSKVAIENMACMYEIVTLALNSTEEIILDVHEAVELKLEQELEQEVETTQPITETVVLEDKIPTDIPKYVVLENIHSQNVKVKLAEGVLYDVDKKSFFYVEDNKQVLFTPKSLTEDGVMCSMLVATSVKGITCTIETSYTKTKYKKDIESGTTLVEHL